jgi:hypothetical protein
VTKILSVKKTKGVAGQVSYVAFVEYEDEPVSMVGFSGSVYGSPGPVVMITGNNVQTFVSEPGRFGQTFDEAWVRKFFAED